MRSTHIRITPETKKELDKLRHQGQTYDGVIKELIEKVEETRSVIEPKGAVFAVKPKGVKIVD